MTKAQVHPTAILEGDVELGEDVTVGPHCVLTGRVRIGAGTRIVGSCYLNGPVKIGDRNTIYPFTCLGFAPQMIGYDGDQEGHGVVVGNDNTIRESVTVHRSMTNHGPTRIGDHNYLMAYSHAGHDVLILDHCVLANGAQLGGHVTVENRVFVGGNVAVHQHCRIGRGAMLSGGMAMNRDLPPFFMLTGFNVAGSINLVGLRRQGVSEKQIEDVRLVYKTLYRRGLTLSQAREALQEHVDRPMIQEYITFLEGSTRGICPAHTDKRRPSQATDEERGDRGSSETRRAGS